MITKQVFPEVFEHASILPVDDYASQLFDMLASLSPRKLDFPRVVVLTPGIYNSAYFEHSYLAQRMGVDLVEGRIFASATTNASTCARSAASSAST